MTKKIIIIISVLVIIFGIKEGFALTQPNPFSITVDSSHVVGSESGVFRSGLMGSWFDNYTPLATSVSSLNKKPFWRLHLGIGWNESTVKPANFDVNFQNWLKTSVDPALKQYQNSGYQVVISLTQVPKWLSLHPVEECMPYGDTCLKKWQYSPPNDYNEWKKLLQLLATTQKQDGITADYIIWDEPDWMFYGTEEQYLEMFKHSVEAFKEVDLNIKIGGPGVMWSQQKNANCPAEITGLRDGECPAQSHTMIEGLIEYVSANSIPLDFIDWHFPYPDSLKQQVDTTRSWLSAYGLQNTLPLTIGEWVFSSSKEEEATEKAASYAIYMLKSFMDNGIYRHSATSIYDQPGWTSGDWAHVGFFSVDGIIKAKWNAFKAIDRLPGLKLNVVLGGNESLVTATAFKDDVKTSVIMASSSLPQQITLGVNNLASGTYTVRKYLIDGDMNEIHSNPCRYNKKTELAPSTSECGVNGAIDQAVTKADQDSANTAFSYLLSAGIPQQYVNGLSDCFNNPTCDVNAYVQSVCQKYPKQCSKQKATLQEAQKLYANLFYHCTFKVSNGKVYTISACIDQINNLKEVSLEGSKQEKQVTVTNGTYSENFNMLPYSVVLIELSQ